MSEQQPSQQQTHDLTQSTPQLDDPIVAAAKALVGEAPAPKEAAPPPKTEAPAPPPVEAKPTGPKPIATESDFEALLRKDADASRRKRQQPETPANPVDTLKQKAATDRMGLLKELGIDPGQLVVEYLSGPAPKAEAPKAADTPEMAELKKELAEMRAEFSRRAEREQEQAAAAQRAEAARTAAQFLKEKAEEYEILNKYDKGPSILLDTLVAKYQEDQEYYDTNGTSPSFSDVAEGVEKYAASICKKELNWMADVKKLHPYILELADKIRSQGISRPSLTKTLDSKMSAEPPSSEEPESEAERVALAIKRITALSNQ